MDAGDGDATNEAVARFQDARPAVPAAQCESALARLRSALFGAAPEYPTLTRYRIERRIGEGGAGIVYLAHDVELDRPVAIKFITGAAADDRDGSSGSRERLLREAESLARAPHPNVVAIYDVGTVVDRHGRDSTFLVLEYVEGADLRVWLEHGHPWPRVLEVFVAAGRGLAAAHAVGVTHRDFKPANAMIGADGRVRVLDFGLARAATDGGGVAGTSTLDTGEIDLNLTEVGTIVGTPAYMSPEQHAGAPVDAASDQYSFCVALWEGLFGARPFQGRGLDELAVAKRRGAPPAPRGHAVPSSIVRALRRGLDPAPARRFASMDELLAALTEAPITRRPGVGLWVGAATITFVAAWWIAAASGPRCAEPEGMIATAPGGARRAAIEAVFAASDVGYAADTLSRLGERVDRFDAAWRRDYLALCEAGPAEVGAAVFDRRMACLQRQQRDADALLGVLADADAGVVARALEVAETLPDPATCAALADASPGDAEPVDAQLAAQVGEQRSALARVHALDRAGKVAEAYALAREVTAQSQALDYAPLVAEALYHLGSVEESRGDYEAAAATLESAQTTAVACNHERIAGRAALGLVFVEGERLGRLDSALRWAHLAEVEFERVGGSEDPSRLPSAKASAYHAAGRYREAKQYGYEALAVHERLGVDDEARRGMLHNNLGDMLRTMGELDAAAEHLGAAQALWERAYGPDHPKFAMALNNLGGVDLSRDDVTAAIAKFRRVLSIRERAFGDQHLLVATSLANLGIALRRNREFAEARTVLDRAAAIMRARGPAEHGRLGVLLLAAGRLDADQGDPQAALATLDEAIALMETSLPPEHPDLARGLTSRALTLLQVGELDRGLADFDRAVTIGVAVYGPGHARLAEDRFEVARALFDRGDTTRAVGLAEQARTAIDDPAAPVARELDAWLAAHGGRGATP